MAKKLLNLGLAALESEKVGFQNAVRRLSEQLRESVSTVATLNQDLADLKGTVKKVTDHLDEGAKPHNHDASMSRM